MSDYNWHGLLLKKFNLPPPACVFQTAAAARKDTGTGIDGSEYLDSPEALEVKADVFIDLCKRSQRPAILSGAGLSTASGIRDYASNNAGTAQQKEHRLTYDFIFSCRPTAAHRVFAAMGRNGHLKPSPYNWVQQNHDGLELRAGWPCMSNLIHGQWLDTWEIARNDNQVVPMSGNLRSDLFDHLLKLEEAMDFCISVGTSHSGLNVDRLVKTSGTRFAKHQKGLGMAMLTIQKTPYDDVAALRVFAKCDDFMMVVARKLGLTIDFDTDYDSVKRTPIAYPPSKRTPTMVKFCRDARYAPLIMNAAASGEVIPSANDQEKPRALVEAEAKPKPEAAPAAKPPSTIRVGNRHESVERENDHNGHKWIMYVDPRGNDVAAVTYELHPTFSPSSVTVTKSESPKFELARLGWGTFTVGVTVRLGNGASIKVDHDLSFLDADSGEDVSLC